MCDYLEGKMKKSITTITRVQRLKHAMKRVLQVFKFASKSSLQRFAWNALLIFNIRAAVALLLRILNVLRSRPSDIFQLSMLVSEQKLKFRVEAVRLGVFVGLYSGLFEFLRTMLIAAYEGYHGSCQSMCIGNNTSLCVAIPSLPQTKILPGSSQHQDVSSSTVNKTKSTDTKYCGIHTNTKIIPKLHPQKNAIPPQWITFVAAGFAGLSFRLVDDDSGGRTIALYTFARALESGINLLVNRDLFSLSTIVDSPIGYIAVTAMGFSLSTAQIMYAYVMRPETLPEGYWNFIVKMGPIAKPILCAVRQSCRNIEVNVENFAHHLSKFGYNPLNDVPGAPILTGPPRKIPLISSGMLRPKYKSSLTAWAMCFKDTFSRSFPVYLSLSLGPALALKFKKFLSSPLKLITRSLMGACRSAFFLGTLCSSYYAIVLAHRESGLWLRDSRFLYYFAGYVVLRLHLFMNENMRKAVVDMERMTLLRFTNVRMYILLHRLIAGLSIFLEKKSRRMELILYCIPRAVDSLCQIIVDRKIFPSIPGFDLVIFCSSVATIVTCFEHHAGTVNPWVSAIVRRLLTKSVPLQSPRHPPTVKKTILKKVAIADKNTKVRALIKIEEEADEVETNGDELRGPHSDSSDDNSEKRLFRKASLEPHWLDSGISQIK